MSKCEEGTASWSPARFGLPGTLAGEGREKKKLLDAPERRSGGVREPRRQSSGVSRRVSPGSIGWEVLVSQGDISPAVQSN